MSTIKNVTVVGASGNLGPSIVQALLSSNFTVTAFTRADSKSTFPTGVHVTKVEYADRTSLVTALKGQDAVVSAIATPALLQQKAIIEAAVEAGVKRFIPSEFGINTTKLPAGSGVEKILAGKLEVQNLLNEKVKSNEGFSWTGVSTSLFFDWNLKTGSLGFSIPNKTATVWDSGDEPWTGTNLSTIGQAIASVLSIPDKFANKYIDIASFITTQNEILKIFEEETGEKWTVSKKSTNDSQKTADEKLAKGDRSAFGDYLKVWLFKDGEGKSPKKEALANKELGLKEEDLKALLRATLT